MAGMLRDTSALYAIADRDDKWHGAMVEAVEACVAERQLLRALIDGDLLLEGLDLRD